MSSIVSAHASVRGFGTRSPRLGAGVIVLDGARIIGDVLLEADASVWYNCVIRGDVHRVRVGAATNIQDNAVLHETHDRFPLSIGARVTVGHAARLHGCTIEDEVLVGISATVLDGAVLRRHTMVAAGSVVPPGMELASGMLYAGIPARPLRELRQDELEDLPRSAARYVDYARQHAAEMPR